MTFPLADFPVAGKTGTAQKVSGSDTDADYSLFIGFGPVPESRYVVAAVIEEAGFGSQVAAPLVARILEPIARGNVPAALPQEIRFARFVARTACLQWQGALAVDDGDDATTTTSTTRPTNTLPLDPLLPEPPSVDENGVALVDNVEVTCTDVLADIAAEEQALAEAEDARGDGEVAD